MVFRGRRCRFIFLLIFLEDVRFLAKIFQRILEDLLKNFGKGKWSEVRGGPGSWDFLEKVFVFLVFGFLDFCSFFGDREGCREDLEPPFQGRRLFMEGCGTQRG